jgi:hypothetical protein
LPQEYTPTDGPEIKNGAAANRFITHLRQSRMTL